MTSEFDAIDYVRELEAAGVSHVQATIHAKALTTAVAVIRGDLNAVARRLTALITEVKGDQLESSANLSAQIVASEKRLGDRIEAARQESTTRFGSLEDRVRKLELAVERIESTLTMMKWALGILAGSQVAVMGMTAKLLLT